MLEADVCKTLQQYVIINKDPTTAHEKLLQLPGLTKYLRSLKTEDEKEHFRRHLRKYVNMYLADCPFEVGTTNRYTITTAEAAIIARKPLRKGESIKYLTGIQVEMTEREEQELSKNNDFSVVMSSRRKRPSLFLGPARFANHDCDSNAKLTTTGPHGIHIVACKEIALGDEITVTYGDDYFGEDNCECLCGTCERLQRNGWDPRGPIVHDDSSDEEDSDEDGEESVESKEQPRGHAGRFKRKRGDEGYADDDNDKIALGERPRKAQRAKNEEEQFERDRRGRFSGKNTTASSARPSFKSEDSDATLNRVLQLLGMVADRQERQKKEATTEEQPSSTRASSVLDSPGRDTIAGAESHDAISDARKPGTLPFVTKKSIDSRDDSMKKKSVEAEQDTEIADSSSSTKSKLPSINKHRSRSNLRNVINANEASDPYSIPASPAPQEEAVVKRGRGRPRKYPRPEDEAADPSSPSSNGTDAASQTSSAPSSATSVETFAAGNVANTICEMLTNGPDASSASVKVTVTTAEAGMTRTRTTVVKERQAIDTQSLSPQKNGRTVDMLRKSPRSGDATPIRSIEKVELEDDSDDDVRRGEARTPGDYTLCKALLATTYHRWVECRNCDEHFVQDEAFLTRIACPRCERHSKLYGYYWPKTDKENKHDKEERVLDHRTIHRFIDPEEERTERKGRRTLADVVREKELSERLDSEESGESMERRLRPSPRGGRSESHRRKLRTTM